MKLVVNNLEKNFQDKKVLKGASYEFESGKIYGLLGRNGSGKTTFFNIVYKELKKDGGEIFLADNEKVLDIRVKDVGMMFSENILPEFLIGYEFIKFLSILTVREKILINTLIR